MTTIFSAIGDIGHFDQSLFQLTEQIGSKRNSFAVILGDNFYPTGITTLMDERINYLIQALMAMNTKTLGVLGNHDYMGNIWAQTKLPFWHMPSNYHHQTIGTVLCVCIDTMVLDPEHIMLFDDVNRQHIDLGTAMTHQLNWLHSTLSQSRARYKVVFGHYPILSSGSYPDNLKLTRILIPIFKRYGVIAYISGHDHNTQHIQQEYEGYLFNQFVVGCSNINEAYRVNRMRSGCLHYSAEPAFLRVKANRSSATFKVLNVNGQVLYRYEQERHLH